VAKPSFWRKKFIDLAKSGGGRKDFISLAKEMRESGEPIPIWVDEFLSRYGEKAGGLIVKNK
jgi:hypothetical protein